MKKSFLFFASMIALVVACNKTQEIPKPIDDDQVTYTDSNEIEDDSTDAGDIDDDSTDADSMGGDSRKAFIRFN